MSEMIDRGAKALCRQYLIWDGGYSVEDIEAACGEDGIWVSFRDEARTVIEAMREPTNEMFNAALNVDSRFAYRAMIDAALKEKK